MIIQVAARDSALSKAQVKEVLWELRQCFSHVEFDVRYLKTTGDLDLTTSLESLGRTDFFTKEIDELVLSGAVCCGIHSAKDLPFPLKEGLEIAAITEGVDPADSLVFQKDQNFQLLPHGAKIGVSSLRRAEFIKKMREDLIPMSIRGTIEKRLTLLDRDEVQALVVAEAALIRLELTHLPRLKLETDPLFFQGKLAIVTREDNPYLVMFKALDQYGYLFNEMMLKGV